MPRPARDLTRVEFETLVVLRPAGRVPVGRAKVFYRPAYWCRCKLCGRDFRRPVLAGDLLTGHTSSCGCLRVAKSLAAANRERAAACAERNAEIVAAVVGRDEPLKVVARRVGLSVARVYDIVRAAGGLPARRRRRSVPRPRKDPRARQEEAPAA